mgnify:CR=1 FL=1
MSEKRILVVGCGKIGLRLARDLAGSHRVWGLRRTQMSFDADMETGLSYISADVSNPKTLNDVLPSAIDFIVYCLTPNERTEEAYRRVYVEGLNNILGALPADTHLKRVFFVSSTSVYHQDDGAWVNEVSPTKPSRFSGKILLDAELIPCSMGYASTSIRFSGIYGGTRSRLIQIVRAGQASLSPQIKLSNRIHEDDCVGFLLHLIALANQDEALHSCYIATDSCPVSQNQVLEYLAEKLGVSLSVTESVESFSRAGSKRCSNERLLASGYSLRYPSYKEGYAAMLGKGT